MTISKFCDRFVELVKADRPDRLARFLQCHLGFVATHKDSIEQELTACNLLQRGSSAENKE